MRRHPFDRLLRPAPAAEGVPDRELARRYAETGDEAAFERLVRRHAAAVWTAPRRVLRDHQAAEDAFQATFLALARRAAPPRTPPPTATRRRRSSTTGGPARPRDRVGPAAGE